MPDTGAPWNIPYVAGTDLVSDWPADSLALANAIDGGLDTLLAGGIGANVVQTVKTDTFTTTSSTFADVTGLAATITPSTATSKILVIVDASYSSQLRGAHLRVTGGGSDTYVGDAASNRVRAALSVVSPEIAGSNAIETVQHAGPIVFLSSPATTSPVTYQVQMRSGTGTFNSAHLNRSHSDTDNNTQARTASSITLIEVSA